MHGKGGGRAGRYWSLLVIASAIAGLLAMHGFEAVGASSPSTDVSAQTSTLTGGQTHSDTCSPELPQSVLFTLHDECETPIWAAAAKSTSPVAPVYVFSNRDVLTAFSVLIV